MWYKDKVLYRIRCCLRGYSQKRVGRRTRQPESETVVSSVSRQTNLIRSQDRRGLLI